MAGFARPDSDHDGELPAAPPVVESGWLGGAAPVVFQLLSHKALRLLNAVPDAQPVREQRGAAGVPGIPARFRAPDGVLRRGAPGDEPSSARGLSRDGRGAGTTCAWRTPPRWSVSTHGVAAGRRRLGLQVTSEGTVSSRPAGGCRVAESVTQRTGRAATLTCHNGCGSSSSPVCSRRCSLSAAAELILRLKGVHPWRPGEGIVAHQPGWDVLFSASHPRYSQIRAASRSPWPQATRFTSRTCQHASNHPSARHVRRGEAKRRDLDFRLLADPRVEPQDEETYPWVLQQQFPEYEVVNFGVSDTAPSTLSCSPPRASKRGAPRWRLLAYADFHDERNTFLRNRQKGDRPWNKLGPLVQPYARLDGAGHVR